MEIQPFTDGFDEETDRRIRQQLIDEIKSAFVVWPKPPEVRRECLHRKRDEELKEFYPFLADKEWNGVNPKLWAAKSILLPILSDRVFTYFLPSILLAALSSEDYLLEPAIERLYRDRPFRLRFIASEMSAGQKRVVINTLKYAKQLFATFRAMRELHHRGYLTSIPQQCFDQVITLIEGV